MRYSLTVTTWFLAIAITSPLPAQSNGQASPQAKRVQAKAIPHTPDGHPDLQGVWTNATLTRLERPDELAGKATLTDAEAQAFEMKDREVNTLDGDVGSNFNRATGGPGVGAYNNLFVDRGSELARVDGVKRTSLIIDPPDGKIPPLTAAARERNAGMMRNFNRYDSVKARPLSERCIIGFGSTSGPPMLPVLYNNNYEIAQTPDAVMILIEMVHDIRVIRINGTHKPASIRQLLGDSIGHWEGDTLVVDTTNFNDQVVFRGSSKNLHVIERFTRTDAQTLLYRAMIDDPTTFSKSWTLEYPFRATRGPIFEYACHEGNYAIVDILGGARKEESETQRK
jgi:hypothetical protein